MTPDKLILLMISRINRDSAAFAVGILDDSLTHDEQISFAHRLVDLAEAIRDRAAGKQEHVVVEGKVVAACPDTAPDLQLRLPGLKEAAGGSSETTDQSC